MLRYSFSVLLLCLVYVMGIQAADCHETLTRGVVALPHTSGGKFISWRFLGSDSYQQTTFDVLRNGQVIKADITGATCYRDPSGNNSSMYQIVTKVNGTVVDTTAAVTPWSDYFYKLRLDRPASGADYGYSCNDCSVGDLDGDGDYELVVKWEPSNDQDNSKDGVTGPVFLDGYKIDWTLGGAGTTPQRLWRIELGKNIRAGAHYTQFLVYDFDGDGCAELMCKTAPGTKDGKGAFVSAAATDSKILATNNSKDWRTSKGRIDGGYEFLTVFNGQTGAAIHTTFYKPNRNATTVGSEASGTYNWDDRSGKTDKGSYGNRGERYLAAVAYLDGFDHHPCALFCRGYYTYAYVWAVSFDGQQIHDHWYHASASRTQYSVTNAEGKTTTYNAPQATRGTGSRTLYGNGNHNLSVGDVDGDGCDELIYGASALDQDGTLLYATGFGHGDAMHLADHNPDRPGLEVFAVHEEAPYGWDLHDAATGEILYSAESTSDNGRGMAAQLSSTVRGSFFSSAQERSQRSAVTGEVITTKSTSLNFRIYWDGDMQEELLDGDKIDHWNGNGVTRLYVNGKQLYDLNNSGSCNGTKATPCIQADLLGDWREEIILTNKKDSSEVNLFSTSVLTNYRVPTLMHDHVYRMGIAWQNAAYNQPPHLGFYLPDYIANPPAAIEVLKAGQPVSESRKVIVDGLMFIESHGRRYSLNGRVMP